MKKALKWLLMLNKRLYKKAVFIVIMLLIPTSVFLLGVLAKEDSGFLKIVLAEQDPHDPVSSMIVNELLADESMIIFSRAETPQKALDAVKTGDADAAWIFPDNMEQRTDEYLTDIDFRQGFVSVIERETNVFLRLSREKLTTELFKYYSQRYYIAFAREELPQLNELSDTELLEYYENVNLNEDLFIIDEPTDFSGNVKDQTENYLTAPIRGLLGLVIALCGMAAALFYSQDDRIGTFSHVPQKYKIYTAFACIIIAVLNVCIAALISLWLVGYVSSALYELFGLFMYAICTALFSLLLKYICRSEKMLSAMIVPMVIVMCVICPVIIDIRKAVIIQHIFPLTYYINSAYDANYFLYMLGYASVSALLCFILHKILPQKNR